MTKREPERNPLQRIIQGVQNGRSTDINPRLRRTHHAVDFTLDITHTMHTAASQSQHSHLPQPCNLSTNL